MKLSESAIVKSVTTTMAMAFVAITGFICLQKLGVDLFPKVEFPVITILSVLPGSDPHTVETTVSKPIEDVLSTLSSIKHLRSTSAENISQVVVEFECEKNIDTAFSEVQTKIQSIRSTLPNDLDEPVIEKFDIDSAPVLAVIVSGQKPIQDLSYIADHTVKNTLQQLPGVGQIKLIGNRAKNIWIHIHPIKLESFSLSIQEVIAALKNNHLDLPGGKIETEYTETLIKTKAENATAHDFASILISYKNGSTIRLGDIATIEDGVEEQKCLAKINDTEAIALLIRRQSGTNTIAVAEKVKNEVNRLKKILEKDLIQLEVTQDMSTYIQRSVGEIWSHLILGGFLAIVVVYFFLQNLRITLISSLAIPLSLLGALIFMEYLHFTLNTLTMLALSLSIGILIDDAIVVSENIFRHFSKTTDATTAAKTGVSQIAKAAIAITLSIVAVFLPVAFMKGLIGRFMYQFGCTVSIAVVMSLLVSLTVTPMLASKWLKIPKNETKSQFKKIHSSIISIIETFYTSCLEYALEYKKLTIAIAAFSLILTCFFSLYIKKEFLPMEDQSEFIIKVKTPLGSTLTKTNSTLTSITQTIKNEPWVAYTFSTIGSDSLAKATEGSIYVKMTEKNNRTISQFQAMDIVREKIAKQKITANIRVEIVPRVSGGGKKNCSLQVDIKGIEHKTLESLAKTLVSAIQSKKGYADIDLSYESDNPEYEISIHKDRAAALQVSPAIIAQTIRVLIGGLDVTTFSIDGNRYNVSVRLDKEFRHHISHLNYISIKNGAGDMIPLSNLISVQKTSGPVQIDRNNKERLISIYINLQNGVKTLGEAVDEINNIFSSTHFPTGYSYEFSGTAEVMKESFTNLLTAMILAVMVIYMVLASQFESFVHPTIIMLTLPFALIGAIFALFLTNATLNINTIIGIIMLMGLVTKNAILLVDYTNTLVKQGKVSIKSALLEAGRVRLTPILMTTLAMIFGMLPVALSQSDGAESRAPMAIATIGGLITSLLLTLILIPVTYKLITEKKERGEKKDCGDFCHSCTQKD